MDSLWLVVVFAVSVVVLASAFVLRQRNGKHIFRWTRIARDALIEEMNDGIIVLDLQNQIVDANRAALEMFRGTAKEWMGQPAARVLQGVAVNGTQSAQTTEDDVELTTPEGTPRFVHVRFSTLDTRRGARGRLILLQDITERKQAEDELHHANQRLQKQLEVNQALQATLQEQVLRDSLTGLHNRRFLHEVLIKEVAQSARTHLPLSLIILDIDHFKLFNDTYGHLAGDAMLKALADWLRTKTRRSDLICRYGGEEFVVLLPGAPIEVSEMRALELCAGFREVFIWHNDVKLQTTLSLGVAAYPLHATTTTELLNAADVAMYAAKEAGRNCVCVANTTRSATAQDSAFQTA